MRSAFSRMVAQVKCEGPGAVSDFEHLVLASTRMMGRSNKIPYVKMAGCHSYPSASRQQKPILQISMYLPSNQEQLHGDLNQDRAWTR